MIKAFFWDILESSFLDFFKASKRDVNAMNSIPKVSTAAWPYKTVSVLNSRKLGKVPFQQYFWPNKEKFIKDQVASSSSSATLYFYIITKRLEPPSNTKEDDTRWSSSRKYTLSL